MSAFRHCILFGYLLSLNRKLFQIDRQTECCAECVNWNYHIQQFPSPGAGLEHSFAPVSLEWQEQQFYLLIIPHSIHCLGFLFVCLFFGKQLGQVFLEMPSRIVQHLQVLKWPEDAIHIPEYIYIHLCKKDYCSQGFYSQMY